MAAKKGPMKIRRKNQEKTGQKDNLDIENELDELDKDVPVVVRERAPSSPPQDRPSSRLGRFLNDTKETTKEHVTRPLSALLKRPGSRSASRDRGAKKEEEPPSSSRKKGGFFEAQRPGTAFGKKFSFGRRKKGDNDIDDDDFLDTSPPRKGASGMIELEDTEPSEERRYRSGGDSPDIPTLDDTLEIGGGLGGGVAHAPSVAVNRVASYKELDNELLKQAAFASLGDIDLSLLTRFLCPESVVREEEAPWSWDYLYTSVCSELRQEWEEADDEEEEVTSANGQAQGAQRIGPDFSA